MTPDALARTVAFATAAAFQATQDLVARAAEGLHDVAQQGSALDVSVIAEETLAFVSVATSRALDVGLRGDEQGGAAIDALATLPDLYREVFAGLAILTDPDLGAALAVQSDRDAERLARKRAFYDAHLPAAQFPTEAALDALLPLWMGRISGPGLPENPDARVARLALRAPITAHLKLVVAFARKTAAA